MRDFDQPTSPPHRTLRPIQLPLETWLLIASCSCTKSALLLSLTCTSLYHTLYTSCFTAISGPLSPSMLDTLLLKCSNTIKHVDLSKCIASKAYVVPFLLFESVGSIIVDIEDLEELVKGLKLKRGSGGPVAFRLSDAFRRMHENDPLERVIDAEVFWGLYNLDNALHEFRPSSRVIM